MSAVEPFSFDRVYGAFLGDGDRKGRKSSGKAVGGKVQWGD